MVNTKVKSEKTEKADVKEKKSLKELELEAIQKERAESLKTNSF